MDSALRVRENEETELNLLPPGRGGRNRLREFAAVATGLFEQGK